MDKILLSSRGVVVTNDGATILNSISVDNPAAKILVSELFLYTIIIPRYEQASG